MQGSVVQDGTDLNAGDLIFVNANNPTGVSVGAVDLTNSGSTRYGINPLNTTNLRDAINIGSATSGVMAYATTQVGGHTAAADTPAVTPISFTLFGSTNADVTPPAVPTATPINFDAQGTATEVAQQTIEAINAVSSLTGIEAIRGNNANGGIDNSIILRNIQNGNEGEITIAGMSGTESAALGFSDADSITGADFDNNTGEIFLSSLEAFTYGDGTPATSATTLQVTGLLNTTVAPSSVDSLGITDTYSTHQTGTLGLQDLRINGIWVPAAENDGISTALPEFSATAKAAAINSVSDQTSVTAEITPPKIYAGGSVEAGTLQSGDIIINGVDIFTDPAGTPIIDEDIDNTFINAINARQDDTGVVATRTNTGALVLKAVDGRNIQIETTENGEAIGHINGTLPAGASSDIYIGQVQLISDRSYMLDSLVFGPDNTEAGLIALGLDGGTAVTGEPADQIGDGKVSALRIIDQPGNIRYTGDRHSELEIKVGKVETLTIARNGQKTLMDTRVFDELQNLEDALLGTNYTEVTSLYRAQDLTATLDSGDTGFSDGIYDYAEGSFEVTITDHDHQPPKTFTMAIGVDPAVDSLTSIADKLNGVPGLNAQWDAENYLVIETDDPDRYSIKIDNDSSHFTDIVNITSSDMQVHALDNSIAALDIIMENLTTQISDFGARSNRIDIQSQIFTNLDISTQENLSEKQDTDFIKAIMDLKATEVAYQAALSSAAKIMQLSLVDYLK
jgi:flagellin-like hook-associated protein FlgL